MTLPPTERPPYVAATERYDADALPARRPERAAAPGRSRSGCGTTSGTTGRCETQRAIVRRAFDLGHHPLRPGQQLRPAVRLGRGELRADLRPGPAPVPRRARHLDQGRLRHVAGPVRRPRVAQVPAREPRPEPRPDGRRLRRHLLLAPGRSGHAARGDDGRARHGRPAGQGALRGHLVLLGGADQPRRRDPARARDAPAHPPALVLDAQSLGRGWPARRPRGRGRRAASRSRRSPRAC